ncbi:DUF429 domain-containing protein [Metabacillus litoralis]|uniref:DUF429 domain-containing protein n=1 Tax=Metabacillus litoralis TaxID=152268 RepID=A0A5C6VXY2_9BACI|nr:DUF429 domain-containing protein [Metabacillus litoralis]TXC89326.1 DUF429 domain-containing protein [Metabacillus litoralis]
MKIIGIDLSGPANHKDTVLTVFKQNQSELIFEGMMKHGSDHDVISAIFEASLEDDVVIGIDAPLSYQDGGGDRPQDKSIRQIIKSYGLSGSSIMPPTLTKMVYLTLRGISLTRRIQSMQSEHSIRIVEVHPGAAIGTRIESTKIQHALLYKKELQSRKVILEWLRTKKLVNLPDQLVDTSHEIDACAAALAAWYWIDETKKPTWCWSETSQEHPYEFCC